nr:uncharacterized protein LOC111512095 [Leptinotarsa decemlineata]
MPWLVIVVAVCIGIHATKSQTVQTTYLCPENFHSVGKKCYHFSTQEAKWTDAHFHCQVLNSTLSVINSYREQNLLKDFLSCSNKTTIPLTERWIDGIYDWKERTWKWGSSGKHITFNAFSRKHLGDDYKWKCIALNGAKRNKWFPRKCTDNKMFMCETDTNVVVQFNIYNKKKRRFDISKCSSGERLEKYEKRKCLKMLGDIGKKGPENFVKKPARATRRRNADGWICPPNMISLGNRCYFFSDNEATWEKAFFECRKNGSKLAIIRNRSQDHNLRRFLNNFIERHDRWIGGIYDWKSTKWRWAMTGQPINYRGFNDSVYRRNIKDLTWNSIFMDPRLDNQWNAAKQTANKRYICQVKAKAVKRLGNNRIKPAQAVISILD